MQNIQEKRIEILKSLRLGELLENLKPVSVKGTTKRKQLIEAFNNDQLDTLSAASAIIMEFNSAAISDSAVTEFVNTVFESLKSTGLKGSLVYASEVISGMRQNNITESAQSVIEKLIVLEDAEIKNSVRAGELNAFASISVVKMIIESAKKIEAGEVVSETNEFVSYTPVSYVSNINEGVFCRVGNKVISINENGMHFVPSPNPKFAYLSSVIEASEFADGAFTLENAELGTFKIDANGISKLTGEVFEAIDTEKFIHDTSVIVESKTDKLGKVEAANTMKFVDALIALKENFSDIASLDNITIVKNKRLDETFLFVVNENSYQFSAVKSARYASVVETFSNIQDALAKFTAKFGFDLSSKFTGLIAEEKKFDETKSEAIAEQKDILEALNAKKVEILEQIKEAKEGSDELTILEDALNTANALIIEQETQYAELVK